MSFYQFYYGYYFSLVIRIFGFKRSCSSGTSTSSENNYSVLIKLSCLKKFSSSELTVGQSSVSADFFDLLESDSDFSSAFKKALL